MPDNKPVAVITGASSGIGKACAFEFAAKGYNLVIAARNKEKLQQVAGECKDKYQSDCRICVADLSNEMACKEVIDTAISAFGKIDVLINNAGISMRAIFADTELSVIHKLMDINFWAMVYCTHYALPTLLKQKGSVVGVSSIAGYRGLAGRTAYSASKFAMNGFLEALRSENTNTGLHVMTIAPGFTESNIRRTALAADGSEQGESPRNESKMMKAETVARHIYKGVKKRKKRIVLTSEGIMAVILNKLFPDLMDKIVFKHMAAETDSPLKSKTESKDRPNS
jgi:dehydrogenase/reductase SDR family member 7B